MNEAVLRDSRFTELHVYRVKNIFTGEIEDRGLFLVGKMNLFKEPKWEQFYDWKIK